MALTFLVNTIEECASAIHMHVCQHSTSNSGSGHTTWYFRKSNTNIPLRPFTLIYAIALPTPAPALINLLWSILDLIWCVLLFAPGTVHLGPTLPSSIARRVTSMDSELLFCEFGLPVLIATQPVVDITQTRLRNIVTLGHWPQILGSLALDL